MPTEQNIEKMDQRSGNIGNDQSAVGVACTSPDVSAGPSSLFVEGISMHQGYIKVWRRFADWEWYKDSYMVHLFLHLISKANHKDGRWQGHEVKRGQVITGRKNLHIQTGIPEQTIRTCLERLKSTNEITIKSTTKFSLITICNYETYQNRDCEKNLTPTSKSTSVQPTTNQQVTTNKNDKNEENEKNNKSHFVPPTIEQVTEYIVGKGYTIDPESFVAYYTSKGWMIGKNKMKDWKSACVTWQKRQPVQKDDYSNIPGGD